jgi:hypothetical protein
MFDGVYSEQILVFVSHPHIPIGAGGQQHTFFSFLFWSQNGNKLSKLRAGGLRCVVKEGKVNGLLQVSFFVGSNMRASRECVQDEHGKEGVEREW